MHRLLQTLVTGLGLFVFTMNAGCSVAPDIKDVASNTPAFYTENKLFYLADVDPLNRYSEPHVLLKDVYEIDPNTTSKVPFKAGDPMAVVLQGVRLPENLPGGTRDIAVVLDVNISANNGLESLVAYYQRDVPPGQLLNFSNLLLYATQKLDPTVAPYFRVRILDVKAERNAQAQQLLDAAGKLNGEIAGLIPHPIIPAVGVAIQAAGAILTNQQNQTLLDFQVQLYQAAQAEAAGDADLGRLYEGRWLVLGRQLGKDSSSWNQVMSLNRRSGQIVAVNAAKQVPPVNRASSQTATGINPGNDSSSEINLNVPYISIVLVKADLQVPSLVMDRSETFINLLSSPLGKSDIEAFTTAVSGLTSSAKVYAIQRELNTDHSKQSMIDAINVLKQDQTAAAADKVLTAGEVATLVSSVDDVAKRPDLSTEQLVIQWWEKDGGADGDFQEDDHSGTYYWVVPNAPALQTPPTTQTLPAHLSATP